MRITSLDEAGSLLLLLTLCQGAARWATLPTMVSDRIN